jgi:membrane protein implicated in regulation of membrane protease activity
MVQGSSGRVTGPMHVPHEMHRISPVEVFLSVFNPMRMAAFALFFGAGGRLLQLAFPWLGYFTLIFAVFAGVVGSNFMLWLVSFIFSKLHSSSLAIVENLIGHMAEVTVPIPAGKVGEITYIVESKRYTSAAKAVDPALAIAKGDRVMISDIENSVTYVEPWTDSFIDPAYDGELNLSDSTQ